MNAAASLELWKANYLSAEIVSRATIREFFLGQAQGGIVIELITAIIGC